MPHSKDLKPRTKANGMVVPLRLDIGLGQDIDYGYCSRSRNFGIIRNLEGIFIKVAAVRCESLESIDKVGHNLCIYHLCHRVTIGFEPNRNETVSLSRDPLSIRCSKGARLF